MVDSPQMVDFRKILGFLHTFIAANNKRGKRMRRSILKDKGNQERVGKCESLSLPALCMLVLWVTEFTIYKLVCLDTSKVLSSLNFSYTGRSNWILHRKFKYSICSLRDVILKIERDLSNSI